MTNGLVSQVESSKGQSNFSTNWRGILETFGTSQGRECLEIHISNVKEGWDYTGEGIRNIKFEYGYGQTGINGEKPLRANCLSARARGHKGRERKGLGWIWNKKHWRMEKMRVKGCHLSFCPLQSVPDNFPLWRWFVGSSQWRYKSQNIRETRGLRCIFYGVVSRTLSWIQLPAFI